MHLNARLHMLKNYYLNKFTKIDFLTFFFRFLFIYCLIFVPFYSEYKNIFFFFNLLCLYSENFFTIHKLVYVFEFTRVSNGGLLFNNSFFHFFFTFNNLKYVNITLYLIEFLIFGFFIFFFCKILLFNTTLDSYRVPKVSPLYRYNDKNYIFFFKKNIFRCFFQFIKFYYNFYKKVILLKLHTNLLKNLFITWTPLFRRYGYLLKNNINISNFLNKKKKKF